MVGVGTYATRRLLLNSIELRLPCGQSRAVGIEREQVGGDVDAVTRLLVDQAQISLERRIDLVGRQRVQDGHVAARAGQLTDRPLSVRVEEVADQHQRSALCDLGRVVADGGGQVGRSGRRFDARQVGQHLEDAAGSAHRRKAPRDAALQHAQVDAVVGREPDVGECRRCPPAEEQLVGRTAVHRRRRVEQDVDGDVLLLDEQLDEQPLEACVQVPVERAQVVAEGVVAVVRELDRLTALDAAPGALHAAVDGRAREQRQPLELTQECLIEDRRVDRRRQEVGIHWKV